MMYLRKIYMKEEKIKKLKYIDKRYLINEEMHKSSKKI